MNNFLMSKVNNCISILIFLFVFSPLSVDARVIKIIVDETKPLPSSETGGVDSVQIAGRAFGEIDPKSSKNKIINDIELAKEKDGKVHYVATFVLTRPLDATKASGLMWHEVPNRGLRRANVIAERANGDIDLTSAWQ